MATNREALQSKIGHRVPQVTLETVLAERGLIPAGEYNPQVEEQRKAMDLSQADVILYLCTLPKSVKELDLQLTQHDIEGLLRLRSGLLAKWEEPDTFGVAAKITNISDLH